MTMANLIRSLVVICTAIQLCNGTFFWSKPQCKRAAVSSSITTTASVRSSSTSNFCTLDKAKQIEYLKLKLSKPVSCDDDDDDSAELNNDSREELSARDHQSMFKLKAQIKSRVLKKLYDRDLSQTIKTAKTKRLLRSGLKSNLKNKIIAARSLKGALKTNYRQTSSSISNSNIVGVQGMFLNLPRGYVAKTTTTTITDLVPELEAYRLGLISTTSINSATGTYLTATDDDDGGYGDNVGITSSKSLRSTINKRYSSTKVKDELTAINNIRSAHLNKNIDGSLVIKKDGLSPYQQRKLDIINRHGLRGSTTGESKYIVNDKKQVGVQIQNGQFKKRVHVTAGSNNCDDGSSGKDSSGEKCDDGSEEKPDDGSNGKDVSDEKCDDGPSGEDSSQEKCDDDSKEQPKETSKECDDNGSEEGGKTPKAALNIRSTSTRSIHMAKPSVANAKINQNVKRTRTKITSDGRKSKQCDDDSEDEITDSKDYGVRGRIDINSRSITQENIKKNVGLKGKVTGYGKYESTHKAATLSTRGLNNYSGKGYYLKPSDNDDDVSGGKSGSRSWENDDDDDSESEEDSCEDDSLTYEYASTYKRFKYDKGLNAVAIIGEVLTKLDEQRYMLFDDLAYHQDCTRQVYDGEHFDYVIVGGGKAGCVLANRLSENPQYKVLLIEAGGHPLPVSQIPSLWQRVLNTDSDWQYETEPNNITGYGISGTITIHKGMCLAGSTVTSPPIWAIGSEQLYNEIAKKGLPEWSFEKCDPFFRKIENARFATETYGRGGLFPISKIHCSEYGLLHKIITSGFEHVGCPTQTDINEKSVEKGFVTLNGLIKTGRTYNVAKAYLTPAVGRINLSVMQYTKVTKIIMDSLNTKAIGVEVHTKYGQTLKLYADLEVEVTAGTIGSAQLLMVSGIGPEEHLRKMNVPVVKNLEVGKNFRHTPVFTGLVFSYDKSLMPNQTIEDVAFKYLSRYSGPLSNLNGLHMAAYLKTSDELSYADVVVHQNYVPKNSLLRLCGIRAVYGFSDRVMNAYAKLNAVKDISIVTVSLVSPYSHGKIFLKNCNPFEKPTVVGNTLGDQRDVDSLIKAIKILTKITESEAMKLVGTTLEKLDIEACAGYELNSDDYWKCMMKYLVSSTSNTSGSCRMGLETDCKAVVDSHLKVIGISNLRVVGQAVFPLNINAYSPAASIMIAERAAEFIKTTCTS